jgi:hypothetical protein
LGPGIANEYADAMSRLPIDRNYNLLDPAHPTPQSNIEISNTDLARESEIIKRDKKSPQSQD